jgi:uncharacterized protein YbjT (DUF2867 family)
MTDKETILVTGATGTVGRHLVARLIEEGHKVRALTRNPATAGLPDEVDVLAGDLTDVTGLRAAFDGVTAAHLINFAGQYQTLTNGKEIVQAAQDAGVGRVTMLGGWQEGTLEPAVRESGLEWTQLRPLRFMSNVLYDWGPALRGAGVVREPYGDRPSPPVHEADIAAVAAVALTTSGHAGQSYLITGPEVLTPRQEIAVLAEKTGRDLRFEELSPDRARAEWLADGLPDLLILQALDPQMGAEQRVEFVLSVYGSRMDLATTVTDSVQRVTGRPPRTFEQWAVENAHHLLPVPASSGRE